MSAASMPLSVRNTTDDESLYCWKDYEDATQYRSAIDEQADCIVTRNKKDFKASTIEVLTPAEFFDKIDKVNS